ncbi:MAG: site-specific integrase, partial [Acidimicrobiales bacterium]
MSIEKRRTVRGTVYDVRLRDLNGRQYKRSFRSRREAETFAAEERSRQARGVPIDPWAGRATLSEYSSAWMSGRADLRPRTVELYMSLLKNHTLPVLGDVELKDLTTPRVRTWHAELLRSGMSSPVTVAKCYRLLKTMLGTAVEDGVLTRNPCVIKGASVERSQERPIASVGHVEALASAVGERYRCLVYLATYCGLRFGELAGSTRQRIDLEGGTVEVVEQLQELTNGSCVVGPPKTEAGRRIVAIPPHLLPVLADHLARFV